jgi:curved DNA-binding protein CbpA
VLGVRREAPDSEVRTAYRRLVQLHHPDHNAGSTEATRRFEEVQEAYAAVLASRRKSPRPHAPAPTPVQDPDVEARLADLEQQVREAHAAREQARRAAREAAIQTGEHATDEELGYITTEDSFSKVLADALEELAARLKGDGQAP